MAAAPAAAALHGAILPHDLRPDDSKMVYNKHGRPVCEDDWEDPDDETVQDKKDWERYCALSLEYYNDNHDTDYKLVEEGWFGLETKRKGKDLWIKCFFNGVSTTSAGCLCATAKFFSSELHAEYTGMFVVSNKVVTSCHIDKDRKVSACNLCDPSADTSVSVSKEVISPLSTYSRYLADGVTLSDKAKCRAEFPLLALAYYSKKRNVDYKLVDALPKCVSYRDAGGFVIHCNFIARQRDVPANDTYDKLFFAELQKRNDKWVVIACSVLRGKTSAGCHYCRPHWGKKVIHPTRRFRFGLYPDVDRKLLRRRH